jgi:hypothetical protein
LCITANLTASAPDTPMASMSLPFSMIGTPPLERRCSAKRECAQTNAPLCHQLLKQSIAVVSSGHLAAGDWGPEIEVGAVGASD